MTQLYTSGQFIANKGGPVIMVFYNLDCGQINTKLSTVSICFFQNANKLLPIMLQFDGGCVWGSVDQFRAPLSVPRYAFRSLPGDYRGGQA